MNRGEIYWVKCAAACGSETRKDRPALIVSNELCNKHSPAVEIVYLTTKEKKPLPTHVETYRGGAKADGPLRADSIREQGEDR